MAIFAKVTALLAIVAAKLPVPVPVTSPVRVIVWSPVLVPLTDGDAPKTNVRSALPKLIAKVLAPTVRFSVLAMIISKAPDPVERTLRDVRESAVPPLMSGVVRTGLASVPTVVKDEVTTVDFRMVLERVLASAVTVIAAEPSKLTPLIALGVVSVAAEPVVLWFRVGKSPATAIVKAPVVVVLFNIPVARAEVPAE